MGGVNWQRIITGKIKLYSPAWCQTIQIKYTDFQHHRISAHANVSGGSNRNQLKGLMQTKKETGDEFIQGILFRRTIIHLD